LYLTRNNSEPIRGKLKRKGANKKLGNNGKLSIAETQGNNKEKPIGDPWR
jgi:hypothetical protein